MWAGRSPAEIEEATRHEALVNAAFADVPTTILCPYPTAGLDGAVLADAETTHPRLLGNGRTGVSPRYTGTAAALAIAARRLPAARAARRRSASGRETCPGSAAWFGGGP